MKLWLLMKFVNAHFHSFCLKKNYFVTKSTICFSVKIKNVSITQNKKVKKYLLFPRFYHFCHKDRHFKSKQKLILPPKVRSQNDKLVNFYFNFHTHLTKKFQNIWKALEIEQAIYSSHCIYPNKNQIKICSLGCLSCYEQFFPKTSNLI
jgi:hypothetical protein